MMRRKYYSARAGNLEKNALSLDVLKKLFLVVYRKLDLDGYFQKYFGVDCTDGYVPGELGHDIGGVILLYLRKDDLYPIIQMMQNYSEEDFFDIIEFLYDHCAQGIDGDYHSWNDCGYHFQKFDVAAGQKYFRELVNPLLRDYRDGYEISDEGEILHLTDEGLSFLHDALIPSNDQDNISNRISSAILKFRLQKSSLDQRKEAIRELADVLEFIRPQIRKHLNKKDEDDLFNIANNFGIRHHNKNQQVEYDKAIWYSWIFYYYLATIHAVIRMANKK
ncbi:hypothetical protein HCX49_08385 [Sphingobacterium kitahiroshimense]|uniref:hypothetical protein n=1 Tax=Sphingobacterium sp. B16(2022) TaxID=2914044 RepID=UPI00143CB1F3|nr:hypothetical protein [Sphingobacterium sp. B16(2022)]NJI73221.1 hypothetical protein [Sphingobacterium sp. B16(2022)]